MATTQILSYTLTISPPLLIALRIAPLLGTSCSLVHAYCELITTSAFLNPPPINNTLSVLTAGHTPSPTSTSTSGIKQEEGEIAHAKSIVLPIWFVNFFNRGVFSVVALNALTLNSSLANVLLFPEGLGEYRSVWVTGLAAAVGHLLFFPAVQPSIRALYRLCVRQQTDGEAREMGVAKDKGKSAEEWMREWNGVHRMRMFSVDLVAWGCFAWGVIGVLSRGL